MKIFARNLAIAVVGLSLSFLSAAQATRQLIKAGDSSNITATAGPSIVMPNITSAVNTGISNGSIVIPQQPTSGGSGEVISSGSFSTGLADTYFYVCVRGASSFDWRASCPGGSGGVLSGYCSNGCTAGQGG